MPRIRTTLASNNGTCLSQSQVVLSDTRPTSPAVGTVRIGLAAVGTTVPGIPTALAVTPGNATNALSWTAPSSNGGSAITGYAIYRSTTTGTETLLTTQSGTATTFNDTGLTNGTAYFYKVAAVNAVGIGNQTSEASGTPTAAATAPAQVTGLSASPSNAQVSLTWSAPANGGSAITGYSIYRSTTTGTETLLTTQAGTGTSFTDTGRTNGTAYFYKVAAVNAIGTGTQSAEVSATPSAVLAVDTFNRADASGLGTSSGGQTWTAVGGRFDISSNQAKIGSYGAVGPLSGGVAVVESGASNCTVQVDLPVITNNIPGIVFRYVDSSNFYYADGSSSGIVACGKVVGGSLTVLGTSATGVIASGDTLQAVLSGSSIIIKKITSGTPTTVHTLTDSALAGTKHGIELHSTGSVSDRWDNFQVA